MVEFLAAYGTEAKCYRALHRARWPQGFRCPGCAHRGRSRFRREGRVYYQCRACRHQTTLVSGTLFEGTKLPLRTWFIALYLLTSAKTNRKRVPTTPCAQRTNLISPPVATDVAAGSRCRDPWWSAAA